MGRQSRVATDLATKNPELQQRVLEIHDRLCAEYGCPIPYFSDLTPMDELVAALLSHRTKNRDSHRAFKQLKAEFPTWDAVRDAPVAEVERAIAPCTWPDQKAPRLQQILRLVGERLNGNWNLDFLGQLPVPEARAWLESLPGVGPKTSAAVLSFSQLRGRALAVDSHHHRVAIRLGIIPETVSVAAAHVILAAFLPENWTAQQVYDHHEVMMLHGQKCCYYRNPECDRCPLLHGCPASKARKPLSDPTQP